MSREQADTRPVTDTLDTIFSLLPPQINGRASQLSSYKPLSSPAIDW